MLYKYETLLRLRQNNDFDAFSRLIQAWDLTFEYEGALHDGRVIEWLEAEIERCQSAEKAAARQLKIDELISIFKEDNPDLWTSEDADDFREIARKVFRVSGMYLGERLTMSEALMHLANFQNKEKENGPQAE